MIRGEFESAAELSPEELRGEYYRVLREPIERIGVDDVVSWSGVDRDVVTAVASGERPELTLEAAAALLATDDERPDGEAIAAEARDILLMGMTTAVVDVDGVAAGIERDMDPKEIQQKIEGRHPITLAEYAEVHQFVASGR